MSTGLIVLAVAVFLVIDGAILFLVFRSRRTADDYAKIPVPGQTTVALPAGKLKLSYQESYKARGTEDSIDFGVPAALQVTVESPAGETLEIKAPGFQGMGSSLNTSSGWSRALNRHHPDRTAGRLHGHRAGRPPQRDRAPAPDREVAGGLSPPYAPAPARRSQ